MLYLRCTASVEFLKDGQGRYVVIEDLVVTSSKKGKGLPRLNNPQVRQTRQARMVDISGKRLTNRVATASGWVRMKPGTLQRIQGGRIEKGDVLAVARIAGVMAAKRAPDLVPLCHPIALTGGELSFKEEVLRDEDGLCRLIIRATFRTKDRTGVEIEALAAVSAAALTVYDMCKSIDRRMEIGGIRLELKMGGRSGTFRREKQ